MTSLFSRILAKIVERLPLENALTGVLPSSMTSRRKLWQPLRQFVFLRHPSAGARGFPGLWWHKVRAMLNRQWSRRIPYSMTAIITKRTIHSWLSCLSFWSHPTLWELSPAPLAVISPSTETLSANSCFWYRPADRNESTDETAVAQHSFGWSFFKRSPMTGSNLSSQISLTTLIQTILTHFSLLSANPFLCFIRA